MLNRNVITDCLRALPDPRGGDDQAGDGERARDQGQPARRMSKEPGTVSGVPMTRERRVRESSE